MVWKPKWLRRGGFLSAVRVVGTYLCCGTLLEVAVVVTQQIARVPRASGVFAGSLGGEGMALWVGPAVFLFSMVSTSCQSPQIFRWFVAATYKKVMLRDAWVKHLDENTTELTFTTTVPISRVNKVTCSNF